MSDIRPVDVVPRPCATASATPSASPRCRLPVGARFPRWSLDAELEYLTAVAVPPTRPVFPLGARFPRRTQAEILGYLIGRLDAAATSASACRGDRRPVGARFPRHWTN